MVIFRQDGKYCEKQYTEIVFGDDDQPQAFKEFENCLTATKGFKSLLKVFRGIVDTLRACKKF
jgi:hypothetical protein